MLRLVAIMGGLALLAGCNDPAPCDSPEASYSAAKTHISTMLRSPNSAEFPKLGADGVSASAYGECNFIVIGFVDAQNAYGTMVRQSFSMEIKYNKETEHWQESGVILQ